MALQRSGTRFGPSSMREATPGSDGHSTDARSSGPNSDNDSTTKLKKRGLGSRNGEPSIKTRRIEPGRSRDDARTGLKELHMPRVVVSGLRTVGYSSMKHESPWQDLKKRYSLELNDLVTIASREDKRLVAVRKFSGPGAEWKIDMLQRIQDKNFVALLDCFSFDGSCYAILEHETGDKESFLITLSQFALVAHYPDEFELAAVLGQILDGLKYLGSIGLEHGSLKCNNILIGNQGSIKIASQEGCSDIDRSKGPIRDITAVGYITMELMQKEARYSGTVMVRDTHRWPLDSLSVNFLLVTQTARSIKTIQEHPLFSCQWREVDIKWIEQLAEPSVFRGFSYPPKWK